MSNPSLEVQEAAVRAAVERLRPRAREVREVAAVEKAPTLEETIAEAFGRSS